MIVIGRFIYECDFALDFGFYDSGYKRLPARVKYNHGNFWTRT